MSSGLTKTDWMVSGRNMVPWHKGGTVVRDLMRAVECVKLAKLDWRVEVEPIFDIRGNEIENNFAVTRLDNNDVLGIVGNRYNPIQNEECFTFFDEVVGAGQAVYDTAGSLRGGRKVWIAAQLPGHLFLEDSNDKHEKWVLLYTSHDGSAALSMQLVAVRVVCANTLSAALRGKTNCYSIMHCRNANDKVEEVQKKLGLAEGYFSDLAGVINILKKQPMTLDGMVNFTDELLRIDRTEKVSARTQNRADAIVSLFKVGAGNSGESRFDALNAVTDYVDHEATLRGENSTRLESALMGSGQNLKERAFSLLVS